MLDHPTRRRPVYVRCLWYRNEVNMQADTKAKASPGDIAEEMRPLSPRKRITSKIDTGQKVCVRPNYSPGTMPILYIYVPYF